MISHKHKCIFVHIPKCGGSSIEDIIWPKPKDRTPETLWMGITSPGRNKYQTGGLQHLLASQIRAEVGEEAFRNYFKFSMVRNPWDKAVSNYVYTKNRKDLMSFIGMAETDDFRTYLSLIQQTHHVQWESQHKFVMDAGRRLIVDFVGRFESFEEDAYKILDQIGLGRKIFGFRLRKIPHANKSLRSNYRDYYNAETKEIVRKLFEEDIEQFGYMF